MIRLLEGIGKWISFLNEAVFLKWRVLRIKKRWKIEMGEVFPIINGRKVWKYYNELSLLCGFYVSVTTFHSTFFVFFVFLFFTIYIYTIYLALKQFFPKKQHFWPPDIHIHICVSGIGGGGIVSFSKRFTYVLNLWSLWYCQFVY